MGRPRPRRYQPSAPSQGSVVWRRPHPCVAIDRGLAWFCLWTAPRLEGKVSGYLREAGLSVFAPVEALGVARRGKVVAIERPFLGRYVFVGLSAARPEWDAVHEAIETPCRWMHGDPPLFRVLRSSDGAPTRIRASALQTFATGLGDSLAGVQNSGLFRTGQRVKAAHGPLEGILGAFHDADEGRVRALFNLLGRQTLVEFKLGQLEAA